MRLLLPMLALLGLGCTQRLTRQEIQDPESCRSCHAEHVEQWGQSMHAYAADDPVFLAMNARGQEETNGELGDFCVNCHAPMAVRTGAVVDGLELLDGEVPASLRGVTCAFCHLAAHVDGRSNNPIELDRQLALKGPFDDPVANDAHASEYSTHLDRRSRDSSTLCGSCHDIVLAGGLHLEETFAEWEETVFADDATLTNCGNCHMFTVGPPGNELDRSPRPVADADGVRARDFHDHRMPGVDVALTSFPARESYTARVQDFLKSTVRTQVCVNPIPGGFSLLVGLENVSAGHAFPSGATQDRRVWAQIEGFEGATNFWSDGVVAAGQPAVDAAPRVLLRDQLFDADGAETHMFWEAETKTRNVLEGIRVFGREETRVWSFDVVQGRVPDRVTLRLFAQPMGLDVLDDLIGSGHLDPGIREEMPTFEMTSAALTWTGALGSCRSSDDLPVP